MRPRPGASYFPCIFFRLALQHCAGIGANPAANPLEDLTAPDDVWLHDGKAQSRRSKQHRDRSELARQSDGLSGETRSVLCQYENFCSQLIFPDALLGNSKEEDIVHDGVC